MKSGKGKGELILLGIFALFMIIYLVDINDLPSEATILSYLLSPFILGILAWHFVLSLSPVRKTEIAKTGDLDESQKTEGGNQEITSTEADRKKTAPEEIRLYKALAMACFLVLSIYFLGFYVGSGIMLFLWFLLFRKLGLATIIISVATPFILYAIFTLLLDFGLYEGQIFMYSG